MPHLLAGSFLACCYGYLAWLSRQDNGPGLIEFVWIMALNFIAYAWAYFTGAKNRVTAKTVLLCALTFRLIGWWGEPLFEDDFYRYLWDGYRFAVDGTPYGKPPEGFFNDRAIPGMFQPILGQINHPDIPTIYGPTFEYLFLLAYEIAPAQLWSLKLLLIVCDLTLIAILLRLTGAHRTLLYAWNPLVIKEIAFTGHPDGVIPLLLIAAWYLGRQGRPYAAGLLLAAAAAAKASIWLMVPFLLLDLGIAGGLTFAAGYFLLYLPFYWQGATDLAGLQAFAGAFEFNSALFGLVRLIFPLILVKALLGFVLLVGIAVYFIRYRRQTSPRELPRGDWIFGGLLLVAPVINPWYLLWLLPFACLNVSLTAWIASMALLSAYCTGLNFEDSELLPYEHPVWLRPMEFGIIGLALILDMTRVNNGT